ncbi:MAG TPA: 50S ribosomal protein L24 [Acidimicrobiales bacterium]|nr:50S ribosomal protein L24 [Acidimicrobiales bacterium]
MRVKSPVNIRIRKGDRVRVLSGKDKGREGTVMRVLRDSNRVIVDGVNRAKRHQRATRATMQGGIIDKDMPVHASSVAIVCPQCGPTRIGMRIDDQGLKTRICRKCGGEL